MSERGTPRRRPKSDEDYRRRTVHRININEARLTYDFEEMSEAIGFNWKCVKKTSNLTEILKESNVSGLLFKPSYMSRDRILNVTKDILKGANPRSKAKDFRNSSTLTKDPRKPASEGLCTLLALSFRGSNLRGAKFNPIPKALNDLQTIVFLDLRKNLLGITGLKALRNFLIKTQSLKDLCLRDNQIRILGIQHYIAEPLKTNTSLEGLDLSQNIIDKDCVHFLSKGLEANQTLRFLNLSANPIKDVGAREVTDLIKNSTSLDVLVLSRCQFTNKSMDWLADSLKCNKSLRELHLTNNNIGNDGLETLREAIHTSNVEHMTINRSSNGSDNFGNKTLIKLDLSGNKAIDKKKIKSLKKLIQKKERLVFCHDGVSWSEDAWKLAKSESGASYIAKAVKLLTFEEKYDFKKRVMTKRRGRTLLEELIDSATGIDTEKRSRREKPVQNKFDRAKSYICGDSFASLTLRNSVSRRGGVNNGFTEAIVSIVTIGEINLNEKTSTDRTYNDLLRHHRSKDIRTWYRRLNAFHGRFEIDDGPSVHKSEGCEVHFATAIEDDQQYAIKKVFNAELFEMEKHAFEVLQARTQDKKKLKAHVAIPLTTGKAKIIKKSDARLWLKLLRNRRPLKKNSDVEYISYFSLPRLGRSLFDVINTERLTGSSIVPIIRIAREAVIGLQIVNETKIMHGDFKPRNFLRENFEDNTWKLIDFGNALEHGTAITDISRYSSAYCPPELARTLFLKDKKDVDANESIDVWSFGVVLYELLSGSSLFETNRVDDCVATSKATLELLNWLDLGEVRVQKMYKKFNDPKRVAAGEKLVRQCLASDPSERPTFQEVLKHSFFYPSNRLEGSPKLEHQTGKTHFFLSHAQAQAAGAVKDLYHASKSWGCTSWLDMEARNLTVKGMFQGVKSAESFVQIVTKTVFESAYCVLELLWAIGLKKKLVFIVEEDTRPGFYPFEPERFKKKWNDDEFLARLADKIYKLVGQNRCLYEPIAEISSVSPNKFTSIELFSILRAKVKAKLKECLKVNNLIPYRRRKFETSAMMEQVMQRIGFVTPSLLSTEKNEEMLVKNRDVERSNLEKVTLYVFAGSDKYKEFHSDIRKGLEEFTPFTNVQKQYVEISPDEVFTPESLNIGEDTFPIFLFLLTPGFFFSKHSESLPAWFKQWEEDSAPIVAIDHGWFGQDREDKQKELSTDKNGNYESIFLHTEVMTYRPQQPLLYEHEAMLKEASKRISRVARKISHQSLK